MIKITFPKILTVLFVLTLISCTKYIYVSRNPFQNGPVVADGNADEWSVPLKYYDEKSKLQYSVTNDNENLYICIKATEDETQSKIFRSGLQIWIDTTANNEHQVGINFPLSSEIRRGDQTPEMHKTKMQSGDGASGKKKFFNDFIQMDLSGFKAPVTNGMTSVQNPYGIATSVNKDSIGILTYEAVIPFRTFYKNVLTTADSLKMIGITVVLKAVPSGEMQGHSGGGRMSGTGGGGGGGMGGGGMRGGGGGGMHGGGGGGGHSHGGGGGGGSSAGAGSEYMNETNVIKKIFQLAVKK